MLYSHACAANEVSQPEAWVSLRPNSGSLDQLYADAQRCWSPQCNLLVELGPLLVKPCPRLVQPGRLQLQQMRGQGSDALHLPFPERVQLLLLVSGCWQA